MASAARFCSWDEESLPRALSSSYFRPAESSFDYPASYMAMDAAEVGLGSALVECCCRLSWLLPYSITVSNWLFSSLLSCRSWLTCSVNLS